MHGERDSDSRPPTRRSLNELLTVARERIAPRLDPGEAQRALSSGAVLVDLRSVDERRRDGVVPGSLHIPRLVLEWRVDPDSGYSNPHVSGLDCRLVLFCSEGFASSFAAADLRELGCSNATDMIGGFEAWKAAGLPVRPGEDRDLGPGELAGMGPPEPDD
jgi:rhodanese-related sulfurtransferase